jgi:hypothetical protein
MIRNTDAMMKSVQVQKIKERMIDTRQAISNALAADRMDMVAIFRDALVIEEANLARAYELLRNPAA